MFPTRTKRAILRRSTSLPTKTARIGRSATRRLSMLIRLTLAAMLLSWLLTASPQRTPLAGSVTSTAASPPASAVTPERGPSIEPDGALQ